jgi:hypothetical protein
VALALGLLVTQLGLSTTTSLRQAQGGLAVRADAIVSLRIARHVLRRELGYTDASRDWAAEGDSLSLRAFRGTALVCDVWSSPARWVVAYSGERSPDPSKDSLEVTYPNGDIRFTRLMAVERTSESCGAVDAVETVMAMLVSPPLPVGVVARVFERGSYHLSNAALRYRRGAGGRQPLTPEVWRDDETGMQIRDGYLALELVPQASASGGPWRGFLAWTWR